MSADMKDRYAEARRVFDPAVEFAADFWSDFFNAKPLDERPLADQIEAFSATAFVMLERRFPALSGLPGPTLALVVAMAVVRSGTHSKAAVENAIGQKVPV